MEITFYILVVLFSIVIHEVSHGYMAYLLGDQTAKMAGRLTLNPLKHLDPIGSVVLPLILFISRAPVIGWAKPVPYNPYNLQAGKWGPAMVAAAGPVSNIVVAVFFSILIRLNLIYAFASPTFNQLSLLIVSLNIVLAIFNLIPIPPLDGSKILLAALPYQFQTLGNFLERFGLIFIILFLIWGSSLIFFLEQIVVRFLVGI